MVLLDTFRAMWLIEIDKEGLDIDLWPSCNHTNPGQGPKTKLHYHAVMTAFLEAISTRNYRTYSYAAGDGYPQAQKGRVADVNDPRRHGTGLLAANKALYQVPF